MADEVLVSEITSNYSPVYPDGGSWEETVKYLFTAEPEHMAELYAALQTEGIREPVVLSNYEDADEKFVLDGTHRVALALYHGLLTLPASYGFPKLESEGPSLVAEVSLDVDSPLTSEEDDRFSDIVRSWRLDEKHWITSSLLAGAESWWEIYLDTSDESLIPAIEFRLHSILKRNFPGKSFKVLVALDKE